MPSRRLDRALWRLALAAGLAAGLAAAPVRAQWAPTGGPAGGAFGLLAGLEGALVAATPHASLRYTDAGGWAALPVHLARAASAGDHLLGQTADGLALSPDDGASFFALAGARAGWRPLGLDAGRLVAHSDSVRVSADGGVTWRAVLDRTWVDVDPGSGQTDRFPVRLGQPVGALVDGDALLVAATAYVFGGVYRLAPGDTSWTALVAPGRPHISQGVRPAGLRRHGGALWFGHSAGVHRSGDGGATWSDASAGLPAEPSGWSLHAGPAGLLAEGAASGTLWRWTGGGWQALPPLAGAPLAATVGASVFASRPDGVYRLDGAAWTALPPVAASTPVPLAAGVGPDGALLLTNAARLLRTTDGGASYQTARADLAGAVAVDADRVFAIAAGGLVRSVDGALTWTAASLPALPPTALGRGPVALIVHGGALWAFFGATRLVEHGGVISRYGAAFRSLDGGATWAEASDGLPTSSLGRWPVRTAVAFGGALFAETDAGCLALPDGAAAWAPRACPAGTLREARTDDALGWIVRTGAGVAASPDGGATWAPLVDGLPAAGDPGTFWSTARLVPTDAGLHLVATVGPGALAFRLDGTAWTLAGLPFPDGVRWTGFAEDLDGTLYGGTFGHGLWRLATGTVGALPAPGAAVALGAPHPNPAAGEVRLRLTLGAAAGLTLTVVDALGRTVATLASGPHAAGVHDVRWAARVAPGVYTVRVATAAGTATRRVTVTGR